MARLPQRGGLAAMVLTQQPRSCMTCSGSFETRYALTLSPLRMAVSLLHAEVTSKPSLACAKLRGE